MAGYSSTPLAKKLGINERHRVALIGAPKGFESQLEGLPPEATVVRGLRGTAPFDVLLLFITTTRALEREFSNCASKLVQNGGLWVCWPKKSSGVKTDLDENIIREFGLESGLVDNKVCAVDEVWSGLRFVVRAKDRHP